MSSLCGLFVVTEIYERLSIAVLKPWWLLVAVGGPCCDLSRHFLPRQSRSQCAAGVAVFSALAEITFSKTGSLIEHLLKVSPFTHPLVDTSSW